MQSNKADYSLRANLSGKQVKFIMYIDPVTNKPVASLSVEDFPVGLLDYGAKLFLQEIEKIKNAARKHQLTQVQKDGTNPSIIT